MTIRRNQDQWKRLIQAYEGSGLSHEQFAESVGVSVWTFRGWLYKLRKQGIEFDPRDSPSFRFVEVLTAGLVEEEQEPTAEPRPCQSSSASGLTLSIGEVSIYFDSVPSPAWVAELLGHLGARGVGC